MPTERSAQMQLYVRRDIFTSVTSPGNFTYRLNNKICCIHVSNTDIFELVIKALHLHVTSVQSLTPILNFYATILQDLDSYPAQSGLRPGPGSKAFALTAFCIQTLRTRDQRATVSSLNGVTASCH